MDPALSAGGGHFLPHKKVHPTTIASCFQGKIIDPAPSDSPIMATAEQPESDKPKYDEWIQVKSKSRLRRSAPRPPVKGPAAISKPAEPRSHKSVIEITAEYHSFKSKWRETTCCLGLKKLVRDNCEGHRRVRKAMCLGVGTFDPEDGGWDAKRRSYIQLDAFLSVVEILSDLYNESIPCSFQEPRFTPSDIAFLTGLGHEVIESPAAFEAVDEEALVFAIHMYRPIYEATLEKAVPAMFVGTGWDVWDEFASMKDGEFKCMSDMHASHKHFRFPQDGTFTTFSSTCVYWRPKAETVAQQETSVGEKDPQEDITIAAPGTSTQIEESPPVPPNRE